MTCNTNSFGKTICSICYEDLKPLVEDLQSISICGHVFHELCLQQWLEYCAKAKKSTCPVCKQKCTQENVGRLYFQSIGDGNDCNPTQKRVLGGGDDEDNPLLLNIEVKKLRGKIAAQTTVFERQQEDLKQLKEEVCVCREQLKAEVALKNEALQQKTSAQQLLRIKSEEFVRASLECSRLQERNMGLAKELAALKLVADLDLDEEDVLKLASVGHGTNSKDAVDVLKKSLLLRNKSYKELMAQCNLLGRGETRTRKKLEKVKEKMMTLKTRVKELELTLEERDNKALRDLKAFSKSSGKIVDTNGAQWESNTTFVQKCSSEDHHMEQSTEPVIKSKSSSGVTKHPFPFVDISDSRCPEDLGVKSCKASDVIDVDLESDFNLLKDGVCFAPPPSLNRQSGLFSDLSTTNKGMDNRHGGGVEKDVRQKESSALDAPHLDEVTEIPSLLHIRKQNSSSLSTSNPGIQCFSGGLLGPDGTNRYLGKWCKKTQAKSSPANNGDLISEGADGRGGRTKVLRSQNHLDVKTNSVVAKKCKNGSKQTQQSQGCLQIDHFFVKAERS